MNLFILMNCKKYANKTAVVHHNIEFKLSIGEEQVNHALWA